MCSFCWDGVGTTKSKVWIGNFNVNAIKSYRAYSPEILACHTILQTFQENEHIPEIGSESESVSRSVSLDVNEPLRVNWFILDTTTFWELTSRDTTVAQKTPPWDQEDDGFELTETDTTTLPDYTTTNGTNITEYTTTTTTGPQRRRPRSPKRGENDLDLDLP